MCDRLGALNAVINGLSRIRSALLCLALGCGCAPQPFTPHGTNDYGAVQRSVIVGERTRTYRLFVPRQIAAGSTSAPAAVVLVFHGGGGTAAQMEELTGFSALAEREGFIAVYPEAVDRNWNDGRPDINPDVDDVAFVRVLLDDLAANHAVDGDRIYATGLSNGGHFCHRLAFDAGERFAAIAPVAAALSTTLAARAERPRPMPILMILGDADPIAPYSGGPVGVPPLVERGEMLSAFAAVGYWIEANAADQTPVLESEPDRAPLDGTRVFRMRHAGPSIANGVGGADVELLTVAGGGHTWPGGGEYLPALIVGRTSRDFSASESIWQFFEAHARP